MLLFVQERRRTEYTMVRTSRQEEFGDDKDKTDEAPTGEGDAEPQQE